MQYPLGVLGPFLCYPPVTIFCADMLTCTLLPQDKPPVWLQLLGRCIEHNPDCQTTILQSQAQQLADQRALLALQQQQLSEQQQQMAAQQRTVGEQQQQVALLQARLSSQQQVVDEQGAHMTGLEGQLQQMHTAAEAAAAPTARTASRPVSCGFAATRWIGGGWKRGVLAQRLSVSLNLEDILNGQGMVACMYT